MGDQTRSKADHDDVLKALSSLASSLDVYEGGNGDFAGPDPNAVARRTDVLGKLTAMLSEAVPDMDDAGMSAEFGSTEWSCCQTASITARISKLADVNSEHSISSPMCSTGTRTLWWVTTRTYDAFFLFPLIECVLCMYFISDLVTQQSHCVQPVPATAAAPRCSILRCGIIQMCSAHFASTPGNFRYRRSRRTSYCQQPWSTWPRNVRYPHCIR